MLGCFPGKVLSAQSYQDSPRAVQMQRFPDKEQRVQFQRPEEKIHALNHRGQCGHPRARMCSGCMQGKARTERWVGLGRFWILLLSREVALS